VTGGASSDPGVPVVLACGAVVPSPPPLGSLPHASAVASTAAPRGVRTKDSAMIVGRTDASM
jgi:hypothetical protein